MRGGVSAKEAERSGREEKGLQRTAEQAGRWGRTSCREEVQSKGALSPCAPSRPFHLFPSPQPQGVASGYHLPRP